MSEDDEERVINRIQTERQLLPQRLMIFLLTNSILFVGFASLDELFLQRVITAIGLVVSLVSLFHFLPIYRRLKALDVIAGKLPDPEHTHRKKWEKLFGGKTLGIWFSSIFIILWGFSFYFAYFYGNC